MQTLRNLMRAPAFTIPVIAIFALSIAANAAIFSIFNGLFLTPMPFPDPHRLLYLNETAPRFHRTDIMFPYADFEAFREASGAFENMAAYKPGDGANLTTATDPHRVQIATVTSNLAATLGIKPILGRDFLPSEERDPSANVVLLTFGFWQRQFEGRTDVLGTVIELDQKPFTIVGVLPKTAVFPGNTDIWMALGAYFPGDKVRAYTGIARLKPGVSVDQAHADLMRIHKGFVSTRPANQATQPLLAPLRDHFVSDYRLVTEALLAGVGFILLIGCINVGGLVLARAKARSKEFSIRGALGAGRMRLLRQVLGESVFLAAIGSAIGVALGWVALRSTIALMPDALPSWVTFPLDLRVVCFSIAITAAAALLSGFPTAFQVSKANLNGFLADAKPTLSRTRKRAMSVLIIGEIAVAFVLLAAGGLMLKAFYRVLTVDPGFQPGGVLTFSLDPTIGAPHDPSRIHRFYDDLLHQLRSIPGVDSAGAVGLYNLPMGSAPDAIALALWRNVRVDGMQPPAPNQVPPSALLAQITPEYFRAMGIALRSGHDFDDRDLSGDAIIVDDAFARRFWPGESNILGKRVSVGGSKPEWMTVIGVVQTVRHDGLDQDLRPGIYLPVRLTAINQMSVVIRAKIDPATILAPARETVRQLDSGTALFDIHTMQERVDRSLGLRRTYSWIFASFAGIALILAVTGIYGVVSYTVTLRTRDIGIRMALGAAPSQVLGQVMRQGMTLASAGLAIGLIGAIFATRFLQSLLAGVSTHDTWTLIAVSAILLASASAANIAPARRAALVDPIRALRNE